MFVKKNVCHVILLTDQIRCLTAFTSRDVGQYVIAIFSFPGCEVIIFESIIFLIKPFFYMTENSRQKLKYLENEKSFQDEISIFRHF